MQVAAKQELSLKVELYVPPLVSGVKLVHSVCNRQHFQRC